MNELLQKHGCSNVFTVPEGLKELMSDIAREVLRSQPPKIYDFIANYLSVLLITREHGILAVKILDDLCDCKPSVSEHLLQLGFERNQVELMAQVIKEEVEGLEPTEGKEKVRENQIMKKILTRMPLDEDFATKVCQVARNAYRDYWYRKARMEKQLKSTPEEPWEIAAQHTLELYKKTKPSFDELTRASQKIQAAYRGYHTRRNLLRHLKPKKKSGPKSELPGPPLDIAGSREIDLGPVIHIKVRDGNVSNMFDEKSVGQQVVGCDSIKAITLVEDDVIKIVPSKSRSSRRVMTDASATGTERSNSLAAQHFLAPEHERESHGPSIEDVGMHKISFAQVPVELIDDDSDVPEELDGDPDVVEDDEAVHENVPEVTDELEGDSAPTTSVSSSDLNTPRTDIEEDEEEIQSAEEEG